MSAEVREWTLEGALDELVHLQEAMGERGLAFVVGAGASVSSGIPAAGPLAADWLHELHLRECKGDQDLALWLHTTKGPLHGIDPDSPASHYAAILAARYRGDSEAGYALLDRLSDVTPSSGYRWLAAILQYSRHRLAITANFDNLIADALALNGGPAPLSISHESLAGYARPGASRPLLARIHHDPLADGSVTSASWLNATRRLFRHYTPIIIGYGGNDPSLSTLLASLQPGDICGRPLWCYHDSLPPAPLREWLARHNGILLQIDDFDSFMARLGSRLLSGIPGMPGELQALLPGARPGLPPAAPLAEQPAAGLDDDLPEEDQSEHGSDAPAAPAAAPQAPAAPASPRSDPAFWLQQIAATDDDYQRLDLYQQALEHCPQDGPLLAGYARFLASQDADERMLEKIYQHASQQAPDSPQVCADYAQFLAAQGNLAEAARQLRRALQLAADDAAIHAQAAEFVASQLDDLQQAGELFQRALTLAPRDADLLGRHARFLARAGDADGAEAQYRRALSLAPQDLALIRAYAGFLQQHQREPETADALYQRARHLAPDDHELLAAHARLRAERFADFDGAIALYAEALRLQPQDGELYASLAASLLCRLDPDSLARARDLLQAGMEQGLQAGKPSQALAEILLLAALLDEIAEGECNLTLLGCLKGLLLLGYPLERMHDFSTLLQRVLPLVVRPRQPFYQGLAHALVDQDALQALRRSEFWSGVEPIDPFGH